MTCNQLGGPESCNKEFHAETFEEMAQLSKEHGMEMFEQGDKEHLEVMQQMKEKMQDPDAMQEWMTQKQKEFDELPDN